MPIRRPKPGETNVRNEAPMDDGDFRGTYPTLYEYLTLTQWSPGQARITSTIMVFVDQGVLKCCLNDRDNNRSAFFSSPKFLDLLDLMEAQLSSETVEWKSRSTKPGAPGYTPF